MRPSPRRGLKELGIGGLALRLPDPLERLVVEAWGCWEPPAFWCQEPGATPVRGWGAGCSSVLERDSFPGRWGPGAVGGLGAGGLGRSVAPPTATPWRLCPATLLRGAAPVGAPGAGGWGGRQLDSSSQRGGFFFLSRAPCLPSSLPFCRLFAAGRPRPAPFWPG